MGPNDEDDLLNGRVAQADVDAESDEADDFAGADPDDDVQVEGDTDDDGADDGSSHGREAEHDGPQADAVAAEGRERPLTRGERRFQELANQRKAAEDRAAALEREMAQLRAERQQAQTESQRRAEQERLALMDPAERAEYKLQQTEERFGRELQRIEFRQQDNSDRTRFESMCARKPHYAAISDEVEQQLAALRRDGVNMSREAVAWGILGRNADKKASGAKTRQTKKAAVERDRQTVRAPRSGGDVQSGGRRATNDATARRARLENQQL